MIRRFVGREGEALCFKDSWSVHTVINYMPTSMEQTCIQLKLARIL